TNTLTTTTLALKNCQVTNGAVNDANNATGDTNAGLLAGKLIGSIEGSWGEGNITIEKGNAGMVAGEFTTSTFEFVQRNGGSNSNHEIGSVNVDVKSGNAGGIAGVLNGSCTDLKMASSCVITVKDGNAGGIAGKASGTFTNPVIGCSVTGEASGVNYVGGMVGETTGNTIITKASGNGQNNFFGTVTGNSTLSTVGGAIGLNTGNVTINNFENTNAPVCVGVLGGIVGDNKGTLALSDSDNKQELGKDETVRPEITGGLVGRVSGGTVTNASFVVSHNLKSLYAKEYVGDVIGEVSGGKVTLSNFETNAANLYAKTEGGMIGRICGDANVTLDSCERNGELASAEAVHKGGFIGQINGGTVTVKKTENKKEIQSTKANSVVGGIVAEVSGNAEVKVESCKNNVTLKAKKRAGGMIGIVNAGHATFGSCEVSGVIESDIVGGIVGQINSAGADFVSCNYNDTEGKIIKLKGSVCAGGIVGDITQGFSVTVDKCEFNGNIAESITVGGIVGTISDGTSITVSACKSKYPTKLAGAYSDYHLNGEIAGGIVGKCEKKGSTTTEVMVQGCTNERSIVGDANREITAGGIVGKIDYTSNLSKNYVTVTMCENLGQVEGIINGDDNKLTASSGVYLVGGICGVVKGGAIEKCHNDGGVTGGFGVVGTLDGTLATLSNSYNTGEAPLGGVVGLVRKGKITYCYNIGKVTTKHEIINATDMGFTESKCYYWKPDESTYTAEAVHIFSTGHTADNFQTDETALDSKQFAKKSSFVGWDFDKIWIMKRGFRSGAVRPVLRNLGDEFKQPDAPESEEEKSEEEKAEEEKNKEKYNPTISMQDWIYGVPNQPGFVLTPGYTDKGYKDIIVQYKKISESAAAYTSTRPTEVGSYHVRVMLLKSPKYKDTDWIGPAVFQIKDQDKGNTIVGYPLPVSNQRTATISSAMGNGIAEIDELTNTFLNRIVGTSTAYDSIKIDASRATGAVRQLVMSRYSMEEIFKMMELRPYITNLKVDFYRGEITLPYEKARSIVAETAGQRLTVELWERTRESLYIEQMNAILNMQVVSILNPRLTSNDEVVSVNGAKVTYPYTLPGSKVIDDYTVYGIDVDGSLREYPFTYSGGQFTFTAGYEGLYVIALREDTRVNLPTSTALNEDFTVRHLGNRLKIGWGKVGDATSYEVFVKKAGSKFDYSKPVATVKNGNTLLIKKVAGKSIGNKTSYKVRVIACRRINGNRVRLGKSMIGYVVGTKNKKYTNTTLVTVRRTICFLSEGETWYIGAKVVLVNKKKKLVPGYTKKFRYKSDDSSVASVTMTGKVIANNPGTCCIYVYAKNGLTRKVKITVE
ncbi:MAG: hypothetical protein E7277_09390, partial [Lachnospiraceae bacterium]|nr:hypothetical protein [Lachnospiraceae bacterium]